MVNPTVAQLVGRYVEFGHKKYGTEVVTRSQHAVQCAQLASAAGETNAMVVASLLHDFGHLVADFSRDEVLIKDDRHEVVCLPILEDLFPPSVTEPIRLHVDAKRYLCAVDPEYWGQLSLASQRSLELQGGAFDDADLHKFLMSTFAKDAVRLRRYDDLAKEPGKGNADFESYTALLTKVARN